MKALPHTPPRLPYRFGMTPVAGALVGVAISVAGMAADARAASVTLSPEDADFFENRIRPVLSSECYECHSSHGKQKSGLVLDHREALLRGGDEFGTAIVPGKPDKSPLIWALRHENDLEMPKAGVTLSPEIIADFEHWVTTGAPDPRDGPPDPDADPDADWLATLERRKAWWSFQPVSNPPIPKGPANAIDAFVHRKLAAEGLSAAGPADPLALVRRLYYNLIGLPPNPAQIADFEEAHRLDPRAAAADLADALLESPEFGGRWARHWMDWIRYAESHGSEGDPHIPGARHYRDYLVRALNADVPYDQLLREHVAGDLLEKPRLHPETATNESVIGPAHFRMVFHGFGPTDALDERVRFTDDLINVFTKSFQGLTVSCARCHNHKFDAISQADFHALFSVFGSTRPGVKTLETEAALGLHRDALAAQKLGLRDALASAWLDSLSGLPDRIAAIKTPKEIDNDTLLATLHRIREAAANGAGENKAAAPGLWSDTLREWRSTAAAITRSEELHRTAKASWDFTRPEDFARWFSAGVGLPAAPTPAGEFIVAPAGGLAIAGVFPAGIVANALSTKHMARLSSPDLELDGKYELRLQVQGAGNALARPVIQNYPRRGAVFPINHLKSHPERSATLAAARPMAWIRYPKLDYWEGDSIHIELTSARDTPIEVKNNDRSWFALRRAALVAHGSAAPLDPLAEIHHHLTAFASDDLTATLKDALAADLQAWRTGTLEDGGALLLDRALAEGLLPNTLADLPTVAPLIAAYRRIESGVPVATRVPGLDEWRGQDLPLFVRGDHKKPAEAVPRRFLDAIDNTPYDTAVSGRRELAADLLRDDNPFTRRVIVNRLWHHLFGRGLVASTDNFGRLGETPSHPELLDHLATALSDAHEWSLKSVIRSIVLSRTWQQASVPSQQATASDPGNRLLSHYPVRRLEAEAIRDSLLAVSGALKPAPGPARSGDSEHRSLYVPVIRNQIDPFLAVFDHPTPFAGKGARNVTNVPAQALTLMNDDFVRRCAEQLSGRFRSLEDEARSEALWRHALGRAPNSEEKRYVTEFIAAYGNNHAGPDQPGDPWVAVAHSLLNTKEFIYLR